FFGRCGLELGARLCRLLELGVPPVGPRQEQPPFPAHLTLVRGGGDPRAELGVGLEHAPGRGQGSGREASEPEERQQPGRRGQRRHARLAGPRHLHRRRQRPPQPRVRRGQAGSTSTARPWPHQRHDTSSTTCEITSSSSTVRLPPTLKWWNSFVRRVTVTSKRVRFPQAAQRYRASFSTWAVL